MSFIVYTGTIPPETPESFWHCMFYC